MSEHAAATTAMAAHLEARLKDLTRGVSGIGDVRVTSDAFPSVFRLMIAFIGWGPSLHQARVLRMPEYHLDPTTFDAIQAQEEERIDRLASLQVDRVAEAARLGTAKPFTSGQIGHLHIDKALPSILGRSDTRAWLVEAMRRALGSHGAVGYEGGHRFRSGGVVLGDQRQEDGTWIRLLAPHLKLRSTDGRRHATLRGFDLEIECDHLPDVVLNALPGRELGTLVRLHPMLDGRIIQSVENRTSKARPGVIAAINLDVDPVDDVLALPHAA
jgi:hypothetical protein